MKKELSLKELYFIETSLGDYKNFIRDLYMRSGNDFYEKKMKELNKLQGKIKDIRLDKAEEERKKRQ